MLNRREVFSVLSGIPLVGWMFSVGEASEGKIESTTLQPGEFVVLPQTPFLTVEGEKRTSKDGNVGVVSYNRIPLGLNFKIVDYTKDKVSEILYRNGVLSKQDSPIFCHYNEKEQISNLQKTIRPSTQEERNEEIVDLEQRLMEEEQENDKLRNENWKLNCECLQA